MRLAIIIGFAMAAMPLPALEERSCSEELKAVLDGSRQPSLLKVWSQTSPGQRLINMSAKDADKVISAADGTLGSKLLEVIKNGSIKTIESTSRQIVTILNPLPQLYPLPLLSGLLAKVSSPVADRAALLKKANAYFMNAHISLKLWNDPTLILTDPVEISFLRNHGLEEAFEKQKQFLKEHPVAHSIRKTLTYAQASLMNLTYAATFALALKMGLDPEINLDSFVTDPKYAPTETEIQILVDLYHADLPYPHLALRIQDRVYSYNQELFSASNVVDYYASAFQRGSNQASWPPSTQVLTLTLPPSEINNLQAYLESQVSKKYFNVTGVVDCSTMIVKALKQTTSVNQDVLRAFDASPHLTLLGLMALNHSTKVFTVNFGSEPHAVEHILRNAWENKVETNYFLTPYIFATSQLSRLLIDASLKGQYARLPSPVQATLDELDVQGRNYFFTKGLGYRIRSEIKNAKPEQKAELIKKDMLTLEDIRSACASELSTARLSQKERLQISILVDLIEELERELGGNSEAVDGR